mmetsp:Transcript_36702/g.67783  ORF Transcript_36702/g.67783 Transcript_36702/m.67783 type:complete len:277 (+) Transcript_36702:96-926(+)
MHTHVCPAAAMCSRIYMHVCSRSVAMTHVAPCTPAHVLFNVHIASMRAHVWLLAAVIIPVPLFAATRRLCLLVGERTEFEGAFQGHDGFFCNLDLLFPKSIQGRRHVFVESFAGEHHAFAFCFPIVLLVKLDQQGIDDLQGVPPKVAFNDGKVYPPGGDLAANGFIAVDQCPLRDGHLCGVHRFPALALTEMDEVVMFLAHQGADVVVDDLADVLKAGGLAIAWKPLSVVFVFLIAGVGFIAVVRGILFVFPIVGDDFAREHLVPLHLVVDDGDVG